VGGGVIYGLWCYYRISVNTAFKQEIWPYSMVANAMNYTEWWQRDDVSIHRIPDGEGWTQASPTGTGEAADG